MEKTAKDFWRMVHDYKVTAVVMCCQENEVCHINSISKQAIDYAIITHGRVSVFPIG